MNRSTTSRTEATPTPGHALMDDRVLLLVGALVLFVLGAFAWTYYLERTACADSAFFSWLMIQDKVPVSVLGRYGSWLPQLLPLALLHIGSSLHTVLKAYSISFILFHALIFWTLAFKLKDRKAAYVLPITLTAGFHYMFYFGISELYQGLSLTLLLWALLAKSTAATDRRSYLRWSALAFALNIWISFYHQLLVLPLLFLLVHEALGTDRRGRVRLALLGGTLLLWYVVRIKAMATSTYEQSRMPTLADLLQYGTHWMELDSTRYLFDIWTKFHGLLLLMAVGLAVGLVGRAWSRTGWTLTFSALFLVLVLIVDRDGKAIMIFENYYPVLGLVWAVHFVSLAESDTRFMHRLRPALLIAVCALGLLQIHRAHYRIAEKVRYMDRMTAFWEVQGLRKAVVQPVNYPWNYGIGVWALGMESALCSAAEGPHYAATLFVPDGEPVTDTTMARHEQFLGPTWAPTWFGIQNLEPNYFDLPTDTGYFQANTCDPTFDLRQLVLSGPKAPFRLAPDRFTVVPITIHNPTDRRMPSCTASGRPVRMSYRLFRADGSEYVRGAELTALETDIPAGMTYHQGLVIERPADNGEYWVIADLLMEEQPFGMYTSFHVVADAWPF